MDIQEIRKQLEAEQAQRKAMVQSDDTAPAPGPVSDTVQNMFNRTVNLIGTEHDNNDASLGELNSGNFDVNGDGTKITKIFDADGALDTPVKDLTHLTTEDEVFNVIAVPDIIKLKVSGRTFLGTVEFTDATKKLIDGFLYTGGQVELFSVLVNKGITTALKTSELVIKKDTSLATKKYVDAKVGDTITYTVHIPWELDNEFELLGTLGHDNANPITLDWTKPNDYVLVSSYTDTGSGGRITRRASFIKGIETVILIGGNLWHGQVRYDSSADTISNNDGNDTVDVYRRKVKSPAQDITFKGVK